MSGDDMDRTDRGQGAPAGPDDPDICASRASELLDRRRIDAARAVLRPALARQPGHLDLLYEAARAEVLADQHADALELLHRLLTQQPSHVGARVLLFSVELDEGRLPHAEEIILGLLRESPRSAIFYALYARLMLRALDFGKAGKLADEALRLEPNSENALHARALCDIAEGRSGGDSPALTRLLVQHPDDLHTLRLVVVALVHARRSREALRLAQELLRAQPHDNALLALVKTLHHNHHWSLLPLWPLRRWGWAGSAGLWVAMLLISQMLGQVAPQWRGPFVSLWLMFVVYSWVWPKLLPRWLERKDRTI